MVHTEADLKNGISLFFDGYTESSICMYIFVTAYNF